MESPPNFFDSPRACQSALGFLFSFCEFLFRFIYNLKRYTSPEQFASYMQMKDVDHIAILVVPDLAIRRHPEDPQLDAVHLTVERPDCSTKRAILLACCKEERLKADAVIVLVADLIADYLLYNY